MLGATATSEGRAWVRLDPRPASAGRRGWRLFANPVRVVQTTDLTRVAPCLDEVDQGVAEGLFAVGLVSYEAAAAFDPAFPVASPDDFPLVWFGLYESFTESELPPADQPLVGPWAPSASPDQHRAALATIRERIASGATYQVNHTLRLRARLEGDEVAYFAALDAAQPSPYSACLDLGRFRVLSVSPELFFQRRGTHVTTRPMKGTAARGMTPEDDAAQREWLQGSAKNRAENVMIVDLLRNDLGRIAEPGAVRVTDLCTVETWPTLHTLTSTVEATVAAQLPLRDLFGALFPCGSVTGAPKASTMRVIADLEPWPRRVYCGAIGVVEPGGDLVFNVPIRTVLLDTRTHVAEYGVGGGITWDSDPDEELAEIATKAGVLARASQPFGLVETLFVGKSGGTAAWRNLDEHLDRLARAAATWGFPFDVSLARKTLVARAEELDDNPWRCRVELSADGQMQVQFARFVDNGIRKAVVSEDPVMSADPRLRFKTTRREVYEMRLRGLAADTDAIGVNERGELTEFTTGNLVVELDGLRVTPPLSSGLLPGVGREVALRDGHVVERVLVADDLPRATRIWHLNSLRGWRVLELVR